MGRERKESVRLRQKEMKGGGRSLYLDIYVDGVRRYEFLKLYLLPEVTRADRERNRETLRLAESVRARRQTEVDDRRLGIRARAGSALFFAYFAECAAKRKGSTLLTWRSVLVSLRDYAEKASLTLADITPSWVEGWLAYLERATVRSSMRHGAPPKEGKGKPLSAGTRGRYLSVLKAALNTAVRDGLLAVSPAGGISVRRDSDPERVFLTVDEVRRLAATECRRPELKRAFLFACLTGLRFSDVMGLRRSDVSCDGGRTRITFRQKKTKGMVYMDITPQAATLMPKEKDKDGHPFRLDCVKSMIGYELRKWGKEAGIDKRIHFHSSRHTFAIMMLELDVDLYTVSKLLGHTDIQTTQIYARILDKRKRDAVDRIPDILGG